MTLEDFRLSNNMTYTELSEFLGLKRGTTFNICKNEIQITLANATVIVNKTAGLVGYNELLPVKEDVYE